MIKNLLAATLYVAMVTVNYLATSLPINNRSTEAISDAYKNLFAPAGITFAIWGLIYLLLGGFVVYQFTKSATNKSALIAKLNPWFMTSSVANISWILAWHYDDIGLSVCIMLILLYTLIKLAHILKTEHYTTLETLFLKTPFSVYFGWITVATIANITVFLVSIHFNGFGISETVWTSIILLVGAVIGLFQMQRDRAIAYGLVLVWAYCGILLKHVSAAGFNGQYPSIIATVILCLVGYVIMIGKLQLSKQ